jgi:hypothetical protein
VPECCTRLVRSTVSIVPQVSMSTSLDKSSKSPYLTARGYVKYASSHSRVSCDPLQLVPANPIEAAASSQASPPRHPCPPVSERGPATVVPTHKRTALARLGIKIACDIAASPPLPHVLAPYPAANSSHMTGSLCGLPRSESQRQVMVGRADSRPKHI